MQLKAQGNDAQHAGEFDAATSLYTAALQLDCSNHVYYSNRSASHLSKGDACAALCDAEECIKVSVSVYINPVRSNYMRIQL